MWRIADFRLVLQEWRRLRRRTPPSGPGSSSSRGAGPGSPACTWLCTCPGVQNHFNIKPLTFFPFASLHANWELVVLQLSSNRPRPRLNPPPTREARTYGMEEEEATGCAISDAFVSPFCFWPSASATLRATRDYDFSYFNATHSYVNFTYFCPRQRGGNEFFSHSNKKIIMSSKVSAES